MTTIVTKVENNRITKFIECLPVHAQQNLDRVLPTYPNAFIYEWQYSPKLWVENGEITEKNNETPEQIISRLERAIDYYLDKEAQSLRYDSIKTIVTYRDDENPKFKAEGLAGYKLRSVVYTMEIEIMNDVIKGSRNVPTESELIAELPTINDYLVYPS